MDVPAKEQIVGVSKQPIPTVGVGSKEGGIRANVEASETLPVIEQELAGIIKTEEPRIPNEPSVGVVASAESTPVLTSPSNSVVLPMTEEEAEQVLKESKSSYHLEEFVGDKAGIATEESKPFLAMIVRKILSKMKVLTKQAA